MTLALSLARLQTHAAACSGIKYAPSTLPENSNAYPFAVAYPELGELTSEDFNGTRAIHTVIVEFHFSPALTGYAIDTAMPVLEEYHRRLTLDPTLNANASTIVWPIRYEFGRLEWAQQATIGFRLHIPIKIRGTAST